MNRPASNALAPEHDEGTIPLPHSLKQKIKEAIVAVSLANFCFLNASFDLLFDQDRFYDKLPATPVLLLALLANIFGLAAVIWLGIQARRRFQNRALRLGLDLLFLVPLLFPVDFIRMKMLNITDYQLLAFFEQPMVMLGAAVVLALVVWRHQRVAHATAVAMGIVSPLAFFMITKNILVCLGIMHLESCAGAVVLPPPVPVHEGRPRVVWIIFDEMDYRLAFEQRPAGVPLPDFDRLRNESLSASDAYSPADGTIISMPSVIIGQRLTTVFCNNTCDMSVMFADTGMVAGWSTLPSVFSEARALGYNTALVGWYLPYDRMLGRALNYCVWYPLPSFNPARAATFGAEMRQQIGSLVGSLHSRQLFVKICQDSFTASLAVVTNRTYGLMLLHLPPPHRPGVYLPEKNRMTALPMSKAKGYFNNLILADHELGALRQAMEAFGEWDRTWVILAADHSWRQSRWYDGKRDMRVPFLVKPPKGGEPMTYSQQFNTVLTHDLILAMLRGEITNEQNVTSWLDAHRSPTGNIPAPSTLE